LSVNTKTNSINKHFSGPVNFDIINKNWSDIKSVYISRRYGFEETLGVIRRPYKSKSYMFMAHDSAKYNSGILKQIAGKLDEMNGVR
jgi:hypothetical protein